MYLTGGTQPGVSLQCFYECGMGSASRLPSVGGFPQYQFASSELRMSHAVTSKPHAPLPDSDGQPRQVSIQVDISYMVLPGDIEGSSQHSSLHSIYGFLIPDCKSPCLTVMKSFYQMIIYDLQISLLNPKCTDNPNQSVHK